MILLGEQAFSRDLCEAETDKHLLSTQQPCKAIAAAIIRPQAQEPSLLQNLPSMQPPLGPHFAGRRPAWHSPCRPQRCSQTWDTPTCWRLWLRGSCSSTGRTPQPPPLRRCRHRSTVSGLPCRLRATTERARALHGMRMAARWAASCKRIQIQGPAVQTGSRQSLVIEGFKENQGFSCTGCLI